MKIILATSVVLAVMSFSLALDVSELEAIGWSVSGGDLAFFNEVKGRVSSNAQDRVVQNTNKPIRDFFPPARGGPRSRFLKSVRNPLNCPGPGAGDGFVLTSPSALLRICSTVVTPFGLQCFTITGPSQDTCICSYLCQATPTRTCAVTCGVNTVTVDAPCSVSGPLFSLGCPNTVQTVCSMAAVM